MKISDEVFIYTWLMVVVEVKCVKCGDLGSEGDAADFILTLKCTSLSRKDIMTDSKNGLQLLIWINFLVLACKSSVCRASGLTIHNHYLN